jgi:polyphenol oxidase
MLVPDWPAPSTVRAACSTRDGGVSKPPYDTLNLGDHVGDDEVAVAANRRAFAQSLHARPVYLKQVHGATCVELRLDTADDVQADACFTRDAGVACTIMVADCLPVLLTNKQGTVVAAPACVRRGE